MFCTIPLHCCISRVKTILQYPSSIITLPWNTLDKGIKQEVLINFIFFNIHKVNMFTYTCFQFLVECSTI